jgi:hypothetical protein
VGLRISPYPTRFPPVDKSAGRTRTDEKFPEFQVLILPKKNNFTIINVRLPWATNSITGKHRVVLGSTIDLPGAVGNDMLDRGGWLTTLVSEGDMIMASGKKKSSNDSGTSEKVSNNTSGPVANAATEVAAEVEKASNAVAGEVKELFEAIAEKVSSVAATAAETTTSVAGKITIKDPTQLFWDLVEEVKQASETSIRVIGEGFETLREQISRHTGTKPAEPSPKKKKTASKKKTTKKPPAAGKTKASKKASSKKVVTRKKAPSATKKTAIKTTATKKKVAAKKATTKKKVAAKKTATRKKTIPT